MVNMLGSQGKASRHKDSNFEKEAKYLDDQVVCF